MSNCYKQDAKVENHYVIYLLSQKKEKKKKKKYNIFSNNMTKTSIYLL